MNPEDFPYRTEFFSSASIINPEDCDEFFAKASLDSLKGLLPPDIDPASSPDIMYFAANGAIAGVCNSNGDAISVETALEILPFTKNKYINTDHKKDKVVGFVLNSGISKFGENVLISEDEAKTLDLFNIACSGGVWRAVNKDLTKLLIESSDPSSVNYHRISLSWEIFFANYDIAVGSKIVKKARIVSDPEEKKKYQKYLKKFGGSGQCEEGFVYRLVKNTGGKEAPNVIIGGYGFVLNPAAAVKGIKVIEEGTLDVKESKAKAAEDSDAQYFDEKLGGLGVPRAEMPQIKSGARGGLIKYLEGKNVSYVKEKVSCATLKPTQKEYSKEKLEGWKKGISESTRSLLVSSDNHLLDGHHQWLAAMETNPESEISVIKFSVGIQELLSLCKDFPSVEYDDSVGSALDNLDISKTYTCSVELEDGSLLENITITNQIPDLELGLAKKLTNLTEYVPQISQKETISVSQENTNSKHFNIMDVKSTADIQANWEAISKMTAEAGVDLVTKTIRDEVMKASEDWCEKAKAEKAEAEKAKAELAEAMKTVAEIKEKMEAAKVELEQIKAAELQRIAAEKYNERMAEIECEYELEDEERKMVAGKIKDMCEEGYAAFKKEMAVMCKEKSKAFKKAQAEKAQAELAVASKEKTKEELAAEALDKAVAGAVTLTPGLNPHENLFNQMVAGFAGGLKVKGAKKKE